MNAEPGRRVQVGANLGRTAVFSTVVVGLTFAMLSLAGTTPREIGRPVEDPSRVQLDQRTFTCGGGIDGTMIRSGSLADGLAPTRTIPTASSPVTLVAERDVAPGAFAGQQAVSTRSLAWAPCPEPQARWWFVAAGGAAVTHDTVFTLSNPRTGEASVDIDVYGPHGLVDSPDFRNVGVPARGTRVIDLAKTAPAVGNLAVSIVAKRGLVSVSAVDRFSPGAVGRSAIEWLPSQSLPSTSVTLAGIPATRGASTLVVANPNEVDAIVKVEVIGATGTFTPKDLGDFIIGPDSVASLPMDSVIDGTPLALRVSSPQRITATVRSVKAGDTAFATGVRVVRGGASFAVPDGAGQLVMSSLKTGASVSVVAFDAHGRRLLEKTVTVAPQTSTALALPHGTRYAHLVADEPDVVVGLSAEGSTGTASAGVSSALRFVRLPKIRPGW